MHFDGLLSRRALLTLGGALAVRRLLPFSHDPTRASIVLGVLVPAGPSGDTSATATAQALAGIRVGAEEAAHAARLFGHTLVLRERTGATPDDARALVADGAIALLTGLTPGSTAALATAPPGVPVVDVLEEDDERESACAPSWLFHVAPGRQRRIAASVVADSSERSDNPAVRAWDPTLEKYGAAQLNARFRARTGAEMGEAAWCGWAAVKAVSDAALRRAASSAPRDAAALADALRRGRFDAHKGRALTFAPCTQRLRQPLWIRQAGRVVEHALGLALLAASLLVGAPLRAQAGATPGSSAAPPRIVVSNEGSRDVSVVDLATRKVVRTIKVGDRPRGIHALVRGDRVLVALSDDQPNVEGGGDAIAELSLADGRVLRRHRAGTDPEQFALLPGDARLYATNEDAGTASAYDLRTGRAVATLVVGIEPEGVAASPDGRWVYVTAETSNSVSVIDTRRDSIVSSFLVDVRPRAAAFSPDGARAWITNEIGGTLTVVDARRHQVLDNLELEGGTGKPVGVVVSPDGRLVYVANGAAHVVSVVDARTLRVVGRIPVGRRPWGITLSRDGRWLVTANGLSNDVSLVDTRTRKEVARVKVGERPWGVDVLP